MAESIVIGAVLRVDLRGWTQAPPHAPDPPIKVEEGRHGTLTCYYDFSPADSDLTASDFGERSWSRLERVLLSDKSPFNEGVFARRFTLDIGLMYDGAEQRFSAAWPPDFLRILGEAGADLNVTHYAATAANVAGGEPLNEDDL